MKRKNKSLSHYVCSTLVAMIIFLFMISISAVWIMGMVALGIIFKNASFRWVLMFESFLLILYIYVINPFFILYNKYAGGN